MENFKWSIIIGRGKVFLFAFLLFSCTQDPIPWQVKSQEQVISEYIETNEEYSEFGNLLEITGLNNLMSVRGPYTLFLPSNEALLNYYASHSIDFNDTVTLRNLVSNHLVQTEIQSADIGLGAIREVNGLGDYLVSEFVYGETSSDIIINKESKITKRDIRCANGYIHLIDKVIEPVTLSVFQLIADNPSFSLFAEGLRRTGLKDTLDIKFFPFGNKQARTRYTVLAVADTTFNRYGINTIDQLINTFTNVPDSITYLSNGFYRYMEYHCLGGTYFLSSFVSKLYPIFSADNNISVTVDTDYKLNFDKITKKYTGFNIDESNYPAKNGTMHTINDLLPVIDPEPSIFTFETTDYLDIREGSYFGKYYHKWYDGQNDLARVKWEGDFLQYYYKNHDAPVQLGYDCLQMFGFWWVEITVPKVMKGNYNMTGYIWAGNADYDVYVDGIKTATVKKTDPEKTTVYAECKFTRTEEHKVKLIATSWGMLFWDTVVFTPIK